MPRPIGGGQSFAFDRSAGTANKSRPQFDQQGGGGGCHGRAGSGSGSFQQQGTDSFQSSSAGNIFSSDRSKGGQGNWQRGHWNSPDGNEATGGPNPFAGKVDSVTAPPSSQNTPEVSSPTANTTSASNGITDAEINEATGGDLVLSATLKKISSDPEGAKLLRDALNKGVTYKREEISGQFAGAAGVTSGASIIMAPQFAGTVSYVAHETAHAAQYPGMNHEQVYELGYKIAKNLGEPENRIDFNSLPSNFK